MSQEEMNGDPETSVIANRAMELGIRTGIQAALGDSGFDSDLRDRYDVFGWPDTDKFDEESYLAMYLRNAYARTVVDKPAFTTWRDGPKINDRSGGDSPTEFEKQIQKLERGKRVWNVCSRADRAAGIGEHGLILLGLSDIEDPGDWSEDARTSSFGSLDDIVRLKPVLQAQVNDIEWGGMGSERWQKPEFYHVDLGEDIDDEPQLEAGSIRVHWTRAINVPSTRLLDDDTLARPRMEPVLNNLIDIEKTLGSAAEQSYRGADYGVHLNFDPDQVDVDSVTDEKLKDEFQKWYHGLQPEFKTVGAEMERLGGEMQDPSAIVEENLNAISAETGIPKMELRGNESGEVSGAREDKKSYFGMIEERRRQYAAPHIVRGVIDRFRLLDIVVDPSGGFYDVDWTDLTQLSAVEQANVESARSQVVAAAGPNTGLVGGDALRYLETGEFPAREEDELEEENLDEGNPDVQSQFRTQFMTPEDTNEQ